MLIGDEDTVIGIKNRKRYFALFLCVLFIVMLCVVPVGAEVVSQIEVNETVQNGDYYKNRTILKNGWYLSVNITANSPVDVFVLSESDFIDYEVNRVVNPPHTEWYSLNTKSFQKNLNVSQEGDYFVVVDNSVVPVRGAIPSGSVNVSGSVEVGNNQAPGWITVLGCTLFKIVAIIFGIWTLFYLIFPFLKYLQNNYKYCNLKHKMVALIKFLRKDGKYDIANIWIFIWLICVLAGLSLWFFCNISFFSGDYNSALYLLSAMLQSLAAIFTITITVTFVIVQIASQTYTSKIAEKIVKKWYFNLFLVLYILTFFLLIVIFSNVDENSMTEHRTYISIAVLVFSLCILYIGSYINRIIDFLKPITIVRLYGEDVKKESVTLAYDGREKSALTIGDEYESDPLQPLRDIANNAISNSNHEVARLAINKITEKGKDLIENEDDAAKIADHFAYHLEKIGKNAVYSKDPDFIDLVNDAMKTIAKSSITDSGMKPLIEKLGDLGSECAEQKIYRISLDIIHEIEKLGIKAVNEGFAKESSSAHAAIIKIHDIGQVLIKNEYVNLLGDPIVEILQKIGEQGIKRKEGIVVSNTVEAIYLLALTGIDSPPFHKFETIPGIGALEYIAKESDKIGLESIKPNVKRDLNQILKKGENLENVLEEAKRSLNELEKSTT